ncbi:hypothetical protein D3C83_326410 [compost metagenome]
MDLVTHVSDTEREMAGQCLAEHVTCFEADLRGVDVAVLQRCDEHDRATRSVARKTVRFDGGL